MNRQTPQHFDTVLGLGQYPVTVLDEAQPQFIGTYAGPASPALTRTIGLVHRANPLTPSARAFVELARGRKK